MSFGQESATRLCRAEGLHRLDGLGPRWVDERGQPVEVEDTLVRLEALRIPPAWREVWASPDPAAPVQATGVDARGRTQYRYSVHAEAEASEHKFANLLLFGHALPRLRAQVHDHLSGLTGDSLEHRVKRTTAAAVRLIDRGFFRVGSERYALENHTYGLTTLTSRHVRIVGAEIEFSFVGKEHRPWHLTIHDDAVAQILSSLIDEAQDPDAALFSVAADGSHHSVGSSAVNSYIHAATAAPATAKTVRTWGGTAAAAIMIGGAESPVELRTRRSDLIAYDVAAYLLGNTRAVARRSYVHPMALEAGRSSAVRSAIDRASSVTKSREIRVLLADDDVVAVVAQELNRLSDRRPQPEGPHR